MTPTDRPCRLVVCRGCCCGTKKKRPGVDHRGQLERLGALTDHEGRGVPVRVSTCLGICFKANVVVVQPSSEGRAAGGRPVWLGDFTEDRLIDRLDDWIFAGGPGAAPLPEELAAHVTSKDAKKPKKSDRKKLKKRAERERKRAEREDPGAGGDKKSKKKEKKKDKKAAGKKDKKKKKKG
ncbi:(2Fe-2S) ferredoxin domain-containing protein [Nocardiopsis sediminis]|uniref:(2Fe-2S) ferredoxin domain-containing protein n=1 Tax=Nocardiopsis sediminis TaxID=1778267 RepID=A0ABV8FX39_9ACTN